MGKTSIKKPTILFFCLMFGLFILICGVTTYKTINEYKAQAELEIAIQANLNELKDNIKAKEICKALSDEKFREDLIALDGYSHRQVEIGREACRLYEKNQKSS
ncbi:hypothetical protein AB4254_21410 [Vibrio breoganii]